MDTLEYDISNEKMLYAFQLFDMDGKGKLSKEEVLQILSGIMGTIENTGEWQGIVEEALWKVSKESDGVIGFQQFKQIMYYIILNS